MTSKLEINIRTLITQCEEMVALDNADWRLKKYLRSLDTMIQELSEQFDKPDERLIEQYQNRCAELKRTANYVEPTADEKLRLKVKPKAIDPVGDDVMREVRQTHDQKIEKDLRNQLFNGSFSTIRRRAGQKVAENLEQTVKQYSDKQEMLAEGMLKLTKTLKDQTETASKIIKNDLEVMSKSSEQTDKNTSSLTTESVKLQDNSKKACKCWMWLMIVFVMVTFIFMVMFMKVMKKRVQ